MSIEQHIVSLQCRRSTWNEIFGGLQGELELTTRYHCAIGPSIDDHYLIMGFGVVNETTTH